jgi:hypothetical protein
MVTVTLNLPCGGFALVVDVDPADPADGAVVDGLEPPAFVVAAVPPAAVVEGDDAPPPNWVEPVAPGADEEVDGLAAVLPSPPQAPASVVLASAAATSMGMIRLMGRAPCRRPP